METFTHLSFETSPITVTNSGIFGGVFASDNGGMGAPIAHKFEIDADTIATYSDIAYHDNRFEAAKSLDKHDELTDEQVELLADLIDEDGTIYDFDDEVFNVIFSGFEKDGEGDWQAQKLRGQVARFHGYNAVEMNDETGTSILILNGTSTLAK